MSYQVIARRWRPQTFDEVTGQAHVTTPLRNAIRTGRVPHAILLTGPRGVGKTTLARILARCLNCEKGPTDTPCGTCTACAEISAGHSTDVQEIDAASRTSVDDVREVIEAIRYAPSPGKHRIFVIDEVHMLSTAAFNALLKTLEEPPPSSLFVFATTNPEKIPFTVVSRCQRYDLRRIATAEVADRLGEIAAADDVHVSRSSLLAIAREGEGSMRDAQTLLDQVISYGGNDVSDETVAEVLDLIDRRLVLSIVEACVEGDAAAALEACARATGSGTEPKRLGESLLQLLRDLVVLRVAPSAEGLVEGGDEEIAELSALAERADETRLRRMFRALVREQEDLAWAPRPSAVLEMAVVRMATLAASDDVAQLLARLDALERKLGRGGGGGGVAGAGGSHGAGSRPGAGPSRASGPKASAQPAARPSTLPPAASTPVSAAADDGPAHAESPPPDLDTPAAVVFDRLRGMAVDLNRGLFASLDGGSLLERTAGRIRVSVPHTFHARRLQDRLGELETICSRFFGEATQVEITADDDSVEGAKVPDRREEERVVRQTALQHPAVNIALEELQAEIVEIRPL